MPAVCPLLLQVILDAAVGGLGSCCRCFPGLSSLKSKERRRGREWIRCLKLLQNLFLLNPCLKGYLKGQATVTRKAVTVSVILLYRLSGLYIHKKILHTALALPPISPEQLTPSVCGTGWHLVIEGTKTDSRGWCLQRENGNSWCFKQQLQHPQIHWLPLRDLAWIHQQAADRARASIEKPPLGRERTDHGYEEVFVPLRPTRTEVRELCGGGEGTESLQCG